MRIEDQHMDVLQNLEHAVAEVYRSYPELTDYDVMRTYEALIDVYAAERIGREPRSWRPTELERLLFENVREMCDWRLSRKPLLRARFEPGIEIENIEPIDVETLTLCLKHLLKSVQTWNKRGGRQGYLRFMNEYLP